MQRAMLLVNMTGNTMELEDTLFIPNSIRTHCKPLKIIGSRLQDDQIDQDHNLQKQQEHHHQKESDQQMFYLISF